MMRPMTVPASLRRAAVLAVLVACPGGVVAQSPVTSPCAAASPDAAAHARLFDRWISEAWNAGRAELVPELVGPTYVRHEARGSRTVTAAEYAAEVAGIQRALPGVRFLVHDCLVAGDRLWVRWTMLGVVAATGDSMRRMGLQVYRLENGRLAETWILMDPAAAAWPEADSAASDGGAGSP